MAFEEIQNGNYENDPGAGSIFEAFEKVNRNFLKTVELTAGKQLSTEDFTAELKTKLDNIEANAESNMTSTEIGLAYESLSDVNRYTDFDKAKLDTLSNNSLSSASLVGDSLTLDMTSGTQHIVDLSKYNSAGGQEDPTVQTSNIIDYSISNVAHIVLTENVSLSVTNLPVSGKYAEITLIIDQTSGSHIVQLPPGVTKGIMELGSGPNMRTITKLCTIDGGANFTVYTIFNEANFF